jgi:DUF1009 family protein
MIAVIAGTGHLPIEAVKKLVSQQKPFFVVVLFPENNQQAIEAVTHGEAEIIAQNFYKPSEILQRLKERGATHVLFIGKVDKGHMLKHISLDWLAIKLLGSLVCKSDKSIMEGLLAELERHNLKVLRQDEVLDGLLMKPGVIAGTLTPAIQQDITLGLQAALAIAHANIGQTVVIKDGMVLAVEAIEGTDACIKRGLELGSKDIVICKAARMDQNKAYDLPTLGPASLANFKPGDVKAIAWIAPHTLIAQQEIFITRANELGITLVSVDPATLATPQN